MTVDGMRNYVAVSDEGAWGSNGLAINRDITRLDGAFLYILASC